MPAPVVQSLDDILASLNPAYSGQEDVIGQQQAALPAKYEGQIAGVEAAKTNAFRDINRGANSKGLAFSGIPIEEQARYTGEKYAPALAGLKTQQNTESMSLSAALAALEGDKRLRALDTRGKQQSALDEYLHQEELRRQQEEFDRWKMQSDQEFQLKLEGLRAANQRALASINNPRQVDPGGEFLSYIQDQFKRSGGQGNPNVSRQQQDAWANAFFASHGITNNKDRQFYWDLFNSTYNRSEDPTKDWRYKR